MIPTTIEVPSEFNKFNFIAETGKPFNTSNAPIEFYTEDDCGNRTPYDITPYTFVMNVYDGDCLVDTLTNLFKTEVNKLYINENPLTIEFGIYDYKIEMVGFNSVVSGKLNVK